MPKSIVKLIVEEFAIMARAGSGSALNTLGTRLSGAEAGSFRLLCSRSISCH